MQRDPMLLADTKAWFTKAANDLRAAEHEFTAVPPLLGDIAFHCQQAAEKAMKGLLTWHDRPFRKTHSLEEIGEQCLGIDATLKSLVDRVVPLTDYAWKFRYPGEPEEPSVAEAREALARGGPIVMIFEELRADSQKALQQSAVGAGAKKVGIPTANERDPTDLLTGAADKPRIVFYSDPTNATSWEGHGAGGEKWAAHPLGLGIVQVAIDHSLLPRWPDRAGGDAVRGR